MWRREILDAGGVLYIDFWDMKQPGIYWFFLAAEKLFGADQQSARLLELIVLMLFSLVLVGTLLSYYRSRWLAAVVPVAAIGSYYAASNDWHLTQAEFIVTFPIFTSAWYLAKEYRTRRGEFFGLVLAGVLAGIAVVFKLAFAPIFVAFLLIVILARSPDRTPGGLMRTSVRELVPFALGVFAVLGIVSAIFVVNGAFKELVWTAFIYPAKALGTQLAPLSRLGRAVAWYVLAMMPWIIFACIAVPRLFRRNEPLLIKLMGSWVVMALAVILAQRFSWWQYHFLLLFVPVAVLGVRGLDVLSDRLRQTGHVGNGLVTAVSLLLVLAAFTNTAQSATTTWLALVNLFVDKGGDIEAYRRSVSDEYDRISREVAQVRDDSRPGPIYVFGNPLIYLLFDRSQAIATQSWGWQNAIGEQWQSLEPDLAAAKPPFIYLSTRYRNYVQQGSPQTIAFLENEYVVIRQDKWGTWYSRASP